MGIIQNFIDKIDRFFSSNENERILELKKDLVIAKQSIYSRDIKIGELYIKINELKKQIPEPFNINDAELTDFFKETRKKYPFKGKSDYLHKSLNDFSKDLDFKIKINKFVIDTLNVKKQKSADWQVYEITRLFLKWLNKRYKTDTKAFKKKEWWLTPQEAYKRYVVDGKFSDCEDTAALMNACIKIGLEAFYYSDQTWRLLRCDINKPLGHAINIWLKSTGEIKRVETTYHPEDFGHFWKTSNDIRTGTYTKIMHLFNENHEYILK